MHRISLSPATAARLRTASLPVFAGREVTVFDEGVIVEDHVYAALHAYQAKHRLPSMDAAVTRMLDHDGTG